MNDLGRIVWGRGGEGAVDAVDPMISFFFFPFFWGFGNRVNYYSSRDQPVTWKLIVFRYFPRKGRASSLLAF